MKSSDPLPAVKAEEPSRILLWRRLMGLGLALVLVVSLVTWLTTRETLPPRVRVAAAAGGGLYYKLGTVLEPHLEQRTRRPVDVLETDGSVENQDLLRSGQADVAILQAGAGDLDRLLAIAPLYKDVLHVVVRREGGYTSLRELADTRIAAGPPRSGMLESARDVLEHYEVLASAEEARYFMDLRDDPELEAAIVTTGLMNPDLRLLLGDGEFDLLPVDDAAALAILHPHFEVFTIPRGLFNEWPPVPSEDIVTVAATSFLATRADAPDALVESVLKALYENDLRHEVPTLIRRLDAEQWSDLPLHPAARRFFRPYGGLEVLANFMESLAALKELLFAFGAGLYLAWLRWQRLKEKERQALLQAEKDRLDVYLDKTVEIERLSMEVQDPEGLRSLLDQVTELKLEALCELTHEGLRGDVTFAIFLQQCGDVIRRIQAKRLRIEGAARVKDLPEGVESPG